VGVIFSNIMASRLGVVTAGEIEPFLMRINAGGRDACKTFLIHCVNRLTSLDSTLNANLLITLAE
jgi:hypothetical protein